MGVTKLSLDVEYDFALIGIRSDARESKIAWQLEKSLDLQLKKSEDVLLEFVGESFLSISCTASVEWEMEFMLLKNKANQSHGLSQSFLLPELKDFDYFVRLEDQYLDRVDEIFQIIKAMPVIQYCQSLIVEDLKSKDNLLF